MLHAGRIFEALKLFIITIKWDLFSYEVKFYLINQKKVYVLFTDPLSIHII